MKSVILIIVTLVVGLSSCHKEKIEGKIGNDPLFAEELRSSPENIKPIKCS